MASYCLSTNVVIISLSFLLLAHGLTSGALPYFMSFFAWQSCHAVLNLPCGPIRLRLMPSQKLTGVLRK